MSKKWLEWKYLPALILVMIIISPFLTISYCYNSQIPSYALNAIKDLPLEQHAYYLWFYHRAIPVIFLMILETSYFSLGVIIYRKFRVGGKAQTFTIKFSISITIIIIAIAALILYGNHLVHTNYSKRFITMNRLQSWRWYLNDKEKAVGEVFADTFRKEHENKFDWGNVTYAQIINALRKRGIESKELEKLNSMDGWGRQFQFCFISKGDKSYEFIIRSCGSDGKWEAQRYMSRSVWSFKSDIVVGDIFYRWPDDGVYEVTDPEYTIPHKAMEHKVVP